MAKLAQDWFRYTQAHIYIHIYTVLFLFKEIHRNFCWQDGPIMLSKNYLYVAVHVNITFHQKDW